MLTDPSHPSGSALRERMIEDMNVRGFTEDTRRDYIRCVKRFAAFIGRSPDIGHGRGSLPFPSAPDAGQPTQACGADGRDELF